MSDGDAASSEVAAPGRGAAPGEGAALEGALALAAQVGGRKASAPTAAWTPPTDASDWPRQAGASGQAMVTRQAGATVTRRADRRRSLQRARQRRRLSVVSGRAIVVALFVVATVVLVLVAQRGGF
jgi:cobalamin biosynthesis Mg chelatase CobN